MGEQCTLIADRTDDAVQLALGFIALSSLYCKWHFETPRRPATIWFMDAMKQGTSAAMVHVLNIVCAIFTAGDTSPTKEEAQSDECAFYFMNVVIDTTLGVYIAFLLLQLVTAMAVRQNWPSLKHPGRYGDPPSLRTWTIQLLSWMGVLVVMKLLVGITIYVFRTPLGFIGSLLFFPVRNHPKIELLIVMIGCPLVMNMVQFWIQDSFLKDRTRPNMEKEPLLTKRSPFAVEMAHKPDTKAGQTSQPGGKSKTPSDAADMYEVL
ncbi:hypothetical protein ATCC90586_004697 [Pythium insidiosum]|nr:hypothetical protein ATCC90586_004697 [Pythium insidiosum]